jgi:hypothetical protein
MDMRYATFLLLVLALVACASSTGTQSTQSTRRSSNLITAEEIAGTSAKDAFEAVQLLRPQWLRTRGVSSPSSLEAIEIVAYVNSSRYGGVENLRSIPATNVTEIRYLNSTDATTLYGTGHLGGAIIVKTK